MPHDFMTNVLIDTRSWMPNKNFMKSSLVEILEQHKIPESSLKEDDLVCDFYIPGLNSYKAHTLARSINSRIKSYHARIAVDIN
jgi:hypothetical protein